jgi:ubiquitin-protein ligase
MPPWHDDMSDADRLTRRVMLEMKSFARSSKTNGWLTISPLEEGNLRNFLGTIRGPEGTPYQGGIFHIRINIPDRYPFKPPDIWFVTKILHPNIDAHGAICMDVLYGGKGGFWSPIMSMEPILISVVLLLSSPNWESPVEGSLPLEWTTDKDEFEQLAQAWTRKYATGQIIHPGERQDGFSTVCEGNEVLPVLDEE